tara:strand:+ start:14827 stop:15222 length:396 start_codon:yes stop_codon:yes gene_type:complete
MARPTTIYIFDKGDQSQYAALQVMRHTTHSRSIYCADTKQGLEDLFVRAKPDFLFVDLFNEGKYEPEATSAYNWAREQIKQPSDRFEAWHIGKQGTQIGSLPRGLYLERDAKIISKMEELICRWEDNPQLR